MHSEITSAGRLCRERKVRVNSDSEGISFPHVTGDRDPAEPSDITGVRDAFSGGMSLNLTDCAPYFDDIDGSISNKW